MIQIHLSRVLGDRRLTQTELSRCTGIRPNTINDLYHEMADRINLEHLDRICEALQCNVSDLIEYVPNPTTKTGNDLIKEVRQRKRQKG